MAREWDFYERELVATLGARFAQNLRARRVAMHQSQLEVAEGMRNYYGFQWHQTMVAKVESGQRAVKLDEAFGLSRLLGIDLPDLIRGERMDAVRNGRLMVDLQNGRFKIYAGSSKEEVPDKSIAAMAAEGEEMLALGPDEAKKSGWDHARSIRLPNSPELEELSAKEADELRAEFDRADKELWDLQEQRRRQWRGERPEA